MDGSEDCQTLYTSGIKAEVFKLLTCKIIDLLLFCHKLNEYEQNLGLTLKGIDFVFLPMPWEALNSFHMVFGNLIDTLPRKTSKGSDPRDLIVVLKHIKMKLVE